jgi:hypothetical protein
LSWPDGRGSSFAHPAWDFLIASTRFSLFIMISMT